MDPIGFALENFDAVGAWRVKDGGTLGEPIDASGQLADGTRIDGVVELRQALMREPETFVRTMTEKLLTYALGRGLTAVDMPVVRAIVRDARAEQLPVFVPDSRDRPQRAVPDADGGGRACGCCRGARGTLTDRLKSGTGSVHVHHQTVVVASDGPRGDGCHAGPAVPRRDGSARRRPWRRPPRSRRCGSAPCSCRWASGPSHWTPATTGAGFEFTPILKPIESVPRLARRRVEPGSAARGTHAVSTVDVAHRHRRRSEPRPRTSSPASRSTRSSPA